MNAPELEYEMSRNIQMSVLWFVCFVSASFLSAADAVPSGSREAPLLGNSTYDGFMLRDVARNLDEVEKALREQGYRITRREDLTQEEAKTVLDEFTLSVPTNGVALVYYAGLGALVERLGKWYNLLRPVGAKIESDNDYRSRGLNVSDIIDSLREESGSRMNLVFLDARSESPIKTEKGKVFGGMREFEVGPDTMVMFAAGSADTVPATTGDAPSRLARSIARHVRRLDGSVKEACEAIASDMDNPWFDSSMVAGIGTRPVASIDTLRDGKEPGDGYVNSVGMGLRW